MALSEIEFNKVVEYVKQELLKKEVGVGEGVVKDAMIWIDDVEELHQLCVYTNYKEQAKKSKKVKPTMSPETLELWKKWWNTWPSTKSVPGTQFKSGAVMKKNEAKMMQKWLDAIESGRTTVVKMQYAAECYLAWGYYESIKNNRNELVYRNSMEVYLNGEMYINYADVEMPVVKQEKSSEANWGG